MNAKSTIVAIGAAEADPSHIDAEATLIDSMAIQDLAELTLASAETGG